MGSRMDFVSAPIMIVDGKGAPFEGSLVVDFKAVTDIEFAISGFMVTTMSV